MKILVFGAGAIGSAFGGFLSKDHDVTLLGRPWHLDAIRRRGLQVSGIWGSHTFRKFRLVTDARDLSRDDKYDLILVTVKSFDTFKAVRVIRKLMTPKTFVLPLQNGLGNIEILRRGLPAKQVLAGRVIFGVILKSGKIKITVIADPTAVGESNGNAVTPRVKKIAKIFKEAGLPTVASNKVQELLWLKVIYNCALNPLASYLGVHYGKLSEIPLTRQLMDDIVHEVYHVASKGKVQLTPHTAEEYLELFYSKLLPRTYDHVPSMLQDLRQGKRTEIDAINGAVVKRGRKYHVKTPINHLLMRLIKESEKEKRRLR